MPNEVRDWNERYTSKNTPWDSGRPSEELKFVLTEHAIKPCDALEIGCGTGTNAVYLAQKGFRVTAMDIVPLAIEQARLRAAAAGVEVNFLQGDVLNPPSLDRTFPFVFDRGCYHSLRESSLPQFLRTLEQVTAPGSLYLVLTGNANDPAEPEKGPPRVQAYELCAELATLFDLILLREFYFDGVVVEGRDIRPLGWSALMRRRPPQAFSRPGISHGAKS